MNFRIWLPVFCVPFFLKSLSCAALCVQADVSTLCNPLFQEVIDILPGQDKQGHHLQFLETPLGSPHSSLRALLMLPWFLELALLGFSNWQNLLGMPEKSASSQVRAWDLFCGESLHLLLSKLQGLAQTSTIFSYLFSILLVLW